MCLAHNYNYRNARIGHRSLVFRYVCPVLVLAILLNIPKLIVISPVGDVLKDNHSFWHLVVLYQVNVIELFLEVCTFVLFKDFPSCDKHSDSSTLGSHPSKH